MTINQTKITNWQDGRQPGAPYNYNSPNLMQILDYLMRKYGGQNLGCYGVRPVRAGSSWSSHAFGAAFDWRYVNPGPGRDVLLKEIFPFLIENSAELGIQAIHDYAGCQIWRSNRFDGKGAYWKPQVKGSEGGSMGASWAGWIHIETYAEAWGDHRTVDERIKVAVPKPTLKFGDKGAEVLRLQQFLQFFGFLKTSRLSGKFSFGTKTAVKRLQKSLGLLADGIYGPKTANAWEEKIKNG